MTFLGTLRLPLLALACALLWGSAFPVIKLVYGKWSTQSLELRLCFAGIRFTLAGLLLLPFCLSTIRQWPRGSFAWLALLALTQTVLQYVFFYTGLAVSSGVLGSILVSAGSLWWIVLAPWLLRSPRPRWRHWMVIGVSSVGVVIAVYAPGAGSGSPVAGTVCFLLASLFGALGAIVIVPLARLIDVRLATSGSLFLGGLGLLACGIRALPEFVERVDVGLLLATLYLAFVSAGAFGIWNWLVREYSVNVLAGYRFLIPISAVTQSTLFISGETLGPGILLGGGLILGSLLYLHLRESAAGRITSS